MPDLGPGIPRDLMFTHTHRVVDKQRANEAAGNVVDSNSRAPDMVQELTRRGWPERRSPPRSRTVFPRHGPTSGREPVAGIISQPCTRVMRNPPTGAVFAAPVSGALNSDRPRCSEGEYNHG